MSMLTQVIGALMDDLAHYGAPYLRSAYEEDWPVQVSDIGKIELCLLGTLRTERLQRWLAGSSQSGAFHFFGNYAVCRKSGTEKRWTEGDPLRKGAKDLSEISRLLALYGEKLIVSPSADAFLADVAGRIAQASEAMAFHGQQLAVPPRQWSMGLVYDVNTGQPFSTGCQAPLFELYCILNRLTPEQAVRCLRRDLGVGWKGLADLPKVDGRRGLRSLAIGPMALPELLVPAYGAVNCTIGKTIDFTDEDGRLLLRLARCDFADGRRCVFPMSCWHRQGDWFRRTLFVPCEAPLPLLHLGRLAPAPEGAVLVVDLPELAHDLQAALERPANQHGADLMGRETVTSWYGGDEGIRKVDWSPLVGRRVPYLICRHSGKSWIEACATAARVYRHLVPRGVEVELFDCWPESHEGRPDGIRNMARVMVPQIMRFEDLPIEAIGAEDPATGRSAAASEGIFTLQEDEVMRRPTFLFANALGKGSSSMIFGPGGTGKTWNAIYLCCALATGQPAFGGWKPGKPGTVLYVDGEMGKARMKRRIAAISKLFPEESRKLVERHFVCFSVGKECPDLKEEEDRQLIERRLVEAKSHSGADVALLVLDNLQALLSGSFTMAEWKIVNRWLRDLNNRGITVLVLHHPNKEGGMLGTVGIRNSLDNVLLLEDEGDGEGADDGIACKLVWNKARDLSQADRKPIHLKLNPDDRNPTMEFWTDGDASLEALHACVRDLVHAGGKTDKEMAKELKMNLNTFKALKKRLGLTSLGNGKRKRRRRDTGGDAVPGAAD